MFTGNGTANTAAFVSPQHLPWEFEWLTQGTGPNSIVITLMDADGDAEVFELVSATGAGPLDGLQIFFENMGVFYFRVEGPEAGWTIWVRN